MMKILYVVFAMGIVGGTYYYVNQNETAKNLIASRFEAGNFHTLEIRYSADSIMDTNRGALLADETHSFLSPQLHFYPYLLMEVKYSKNDTTTSEGIILWGMHDGEMVTSTGNWDKTHGFEELIDSNADKNDFKIINALAAAGGSLTRKDLGHTIHVEAEVLDKWIDSCRKKKLVVQSGNGYRLHFEKPNILISPETVLDHWLVTQPYKDARRESKKYSKRQIERIASLAFTKDFTIKRVSEIFLPVYRIDVQNPDQSIYTTYWNALNGKQLKNLNLIL